MGKKVECGTERGKGMLFSELKCKEVINCRDCERLGRVYDIELDECGCIKKLFVGSKGRFLKILTGEQEYVICFQQIKQIGMDIILVDCG